MPAQPGLSHGASRPSPSHSATLILGIETSCDETGAAVVAEGRHVLASIVASQDALHLPYRGVVPEIAARAHLSAILPVIDQALRSAGTTPDKLAAVAAVNTPGLIGALLVGLTAAKTLAWAFGKPLVAVSHLHAHLYSANLGRERTSFPCVGLVVSGGHTSLYYSADELTHERLGATQDDAAGEAFDKVAAILGLGYPGGPAVDAAARRGRPAAVRFPRARLGARSLDFSFSGIKTAVLYYCRRLAGQGGDHRPGAPRAASAAFPPPLTEQQQCDIAAAFQEAVVEVIVEKTMAAVRRKRAERLVVGGGVARNSLLRDQLARQAARAGVELILPDPVYCVDNGAMVAGLAYHALRRGLCSGLDVDALPRQLESRAPYPRKP